MKYELYLAIRHLKARSRKNIISIITLISILGITLGVACLIVVLAVMTGFTDELRDKMMSINAHINVFPRASEYFEEYDKTIQKIGAIREIVAASPFILEKIQVRSGEHDPVSLTIHGIDPDRGAKVTAIEKYVTEGDYRRLSSQDSTILVGSELKKDLQIK